MLFHSVDFLLFFTIIFSAYYLLNFRYRWALLLFASYFFYMWWKPAYALLILFSTSVDYFSALKISQSKEKTPRRFWLIVSLSTNLGLLGCFKYLDFFTESFETFIHLFGADNHFPRFDWLLPVGISFYTFQTLSYTIDVYRKKIAPEKHFGIFALYVSFFPQLVAGPIERASNLIPQFYKNIRWDTQKIQYGVLLTLWGFFKKLVIADRLAVYVDQVYANPEYFDGGYSLMATYCFGFQVYCDFSAYSDIAVGVASMLGIRIMQNFQRPFLATSLLDFFSRWHVSFMLWLRDYVFIPLRKKIPNVNFNLFTIFLISGLWHGASWTFIFWGGLNGLLIVIGRIGKKYMKRRFLFKGLEKNLNRLITFHLYLLGTIFFRASCIEDVFIIFDNILLGGYQQLGKYFNILDSTYEMSIALAGITILLTIEILQSKGIHFQKILLNKNRVITYLAFYSLLFTVLLFGWFGGNEFIYFQF